ncbi:unnamed protein product [Callosobruchus maculatus]|uniref:Uncharacterized protein n=1 Tax=Callosobruchus maculatus TaxID=64391 RepID=A0A653CMC4_CALMS|nr:unnamed protein product [Callosobruchus maculatus]
MYFLPGISRGLQQVVLVDQKVGHKVPLVALKAWGRLTTLMMQDYNPSYKQEGLQDVDINALSTSASNTPKQKFTTKEAVENYLQSTVRSPEWYEQNDKKLEELVKEFRKLTTHSHPNLRYELLQASELILENCITTMPRSARHFIEIVFILSEDEEEYISTQSMSLLTRLSVKLNCPIFRAMLAYLVNGFHQCINDMPTIFNGLDEGEKLASINLLIGYLSLFGIYKLTYILLSAQNLNMLIQTLLQISELLKCSLPFEVSGVRSAMLDNSTKSSWKQFMHFRDDRIQMKIEKLCSFLGTGEFFHMVVDALLDIIQYDAANMKEAVFVLNSTITGCEITTDSTKILNAILRTYIEPRNFDLPLEVYIYAGGVNCSLDKVHNNIIQVCILLDGIGKIALALGIHFQNHLQRVLCLVFEKAGNRHPYVSSTGVLALENISKACGYESIKHLITTNIDYISFYVKHQLKVVEEKKKVLQIISVILTYTSLDVLPHISDLINYAVDSIDENITNAQVFLEVFNEFIVTLRRWLGVATKIEPIKSREQRYQEMQEFTVSGIDDFSDDTLEKLSAEEMFEQDLKKKQEELLKEIEEPEIEEYKKPDPPLTVVLTTKILRRTLHFLPSKNRERRMKALKILLDGIEILGDWEDELLPIVHEIWSPLVERFKEFDNPLIINYCFQLLIILGNLSKEFIRMRTTKEVLPHIVQLMKDQSTESFMKDRGSSYRYTQAYKLQLCVMSGIGRLMVDLDVTEEKIKEVVGMLILYLSNKQPVPLQEAVMESLKALLIYDKCTVIPKLELLQGDLEFQRNVNLLLGWSESKKLTDERDSSRNQQPKLVAKSVELSS